MIETYLILTSNDTVMVLTSTDEDTDARHCIQVTQDVYQTVVKHGWTAVWETVARPKGSPYHIGWVICQPKTPQAWGRMRKVLKETYLTNG